MSFVLQGMAARVTTVDKHDIYHSSDVDIAEASPRPLMTITTTVKEVIQFAPYRDSNSPCRRRKVYTHCRTVKEKSWLASGVVHTTESFFSLNQTAAHDLFFFTYITCSTILLQDDD